jgi:hypothetical protein
MSDRELDRVPRQAPDGSLYLSSDAAVANLALPTAAAGVGFNGAAAAPPMAAGNVDAGLKEVNAAVAAIVPGVASSAFRIPRVAIAQGLAAGEITYSGLIAVGGTGGAVSEQHYVLVQVIDNGGTTSTVAAAPAWTPSDGHVVVETGALSLIQTLADGTFAGKIGNLTAGSSARLRLEVFARNWGGVPFYGAATPFYSAAAVVKA